MRGSRLRSVPFITALIYAALCACAGVACGRAPPGALGANSLLTAGEQQAMINLDAGPLRPDRLSPATTLPDSALGEPISLAAPFSQVPAMVSRRDEHLGAVEDLQRRIKIAEEIGEGGARQYAAENGWTPVFDGTQRGMRQGIDQVYEDASGTVYAVEAKGGKSQLAQYYIEQQGTPEYAVKAAEKMLTSEASTPEEVAAGRKVLEAARDGNLECVVIRTPHILGEPGVPQFESSVPCTPRAQAMAGEILDRNGSGSTLAPAPGPAAGAPYVDAPQAAVGQGPVTLEDGTPMLTAGEGLGEEADDATGGILTLAGDSAGDGAWPLLVIYESVQAARWGNRDISTADFAESTARLAGGLAGYALAGAAISTFFGPEATPLGMVIGAAVGAVSGYAAQSATADYFQNLDRQLTAKQNREVMASLVKYYAAKPASLGTPK